MKTKEFIKRINELNYIVLQGTTETSVFDNLTHNRVAQINEKYHNKVNLEYTPLDIFDIVVSYAKTPVSERRDVIRKQVKVALTDENGCLHIRFF